jgi:hypothetical protein
MVCVGFSELKKALVLHTDLNRRDLVKRQNRTIISTLTKSLQQFGKSWADHLKFGEWSYNTMPIAKTGMSPYLVFYGQEPLLPSFADLVVEDIKDKSARGHIQKLKERAKSIRDEAQRRMERRRAEEAERYNRKAKHTPYEEGDMVYTRVPSKERTKLEPKWTGPLRVTRRRSSPHGGPGTTYECQKQDGSSCVRNYEQLKEVRAPIPKAIHAFRTKEEVLNLTPILPVIMSISFGNPTPPVSAGTRSHDQNMEGGGETENIDQVYMSSYM